MNIVLIEIIIVICVVVYHVMVLFLWGIQIGTELRDSVSEENKNRLKNVSSIYAQTTVVKQKITAHEELISRRQEPPPIPLNL